MDTGDVKYECRYSGHAGTLILHLYDPDIMFESEEFEQEILKYCLTLIGPKASVYWLQVENPDVLQMVEGIAFNPMIYRKIQIYAMLPEDFAVGLTHIYEHMSKQPRYQLAGFVINLRSWKHIGPYEIAVILQTMRLYSIFFRQKFNEDEDQQHRIVLHLPGTQTVLTALARERATIVRV